MKVESYAATRPQTGQSQNQDDFWISRGAFPTCGIADGSGNALKAARKVLALFSKLHADVEKSTPERLLEPDTWRNWIKLLDSSLLGGGTQSTFCAFTVGGIIEAGKRKDVACGVAVGDSRLFVISKAGDVQIITGEKSRLGSGAAQAVTFKVEMESRCLLLLCTDGAYTPMPLSELQKIVVTKAVQHLSAVPIAVIERAAKYGNSLADDATALVCRVR